MEVHHQVEAGGVLECIGEGGDPGTLVPSHDVSLLHEEGSLVCVGGGGGAVCVICVWGGMCVLYVCMCVSYVCVHVCGVCGHMCACGGVGICVHVSYVHVYPLQCSVVYMHAVECITQ